MTPLALTGTLLWAAVGLVMLTLDARVEWLRICLAGFVAGCLLTAMMIGYDRRVIGRRAPGRRTTDGRPAAPNGAQHAHHPD